MLIDGESGLPWVSARRSVRFVDKNMTEAAERAQLYGRLEEATGIQHGETLSWILNGDVLASSKAAALGEHPPGGERLASSGPTAASARPTSMLP